MHELSLAEAVMDIVATHAGERRVERVEVKVGQLRQVVPEAMTFAFELVSQGTVAEGAELVIEHVPVRGSCRTCGTNARLPGFPLVCRECGSQEIEIVNGEELCVESLDVVDAERICEEAV